MNRHRILAVFTTLIMTLLLISCNSNAPAKNITSIELEIPTGDACYTENGYALFSGRTYSVSRDFATRGYIDNSSSYSYVNAKIYAQDALSESSQAFEIADDFRATPGYIYDVWAEYEGKKSKEIQVCGYEANSVFSASFTVDTLNKDYTYSDLVKKIRNAWFFDESGALKSDFGSGVPNLTFLFAESASLEEGTVKELNGKSGETTIGDTKYDMLIIYSDPTTPFSIVKEITVYDPKSDFDEIALNTVHIDRANRSLEGLTYVKRLNGTTIKSGISPFESSTILKSDHTITVSSEGSEPQVFSSGQSVDYDFVSGTQYTITLTVKSGGKDYSRSKKVTFSK